MGSCYVGTSGHDADPGTWAEQGALSDIGVSGRWPLVVGYWSLQCSGTSGFPTLRGRTVGRGGTGCVNFGHSGRTFGWQTLDLGGIVPVILSFIVCRIVGGCHCCHMTTAPETAADGDRDITADD
uniref:Uncharacterized protein n=1 Tax=Glossina morsitans morsitans TaxID=37546 RepID=A0A1B0GB87_GLOMM